MLAPTSKLGDLKVSGLESRKTMLKLWVYYAPLKDNFPPFSKFPLAHKTYDLDKITPNFFLRLVLLNSATKESLTIPSHPITSFHSFLHINIQALPES